MNTEPTATITTDLRTITWYWNCRVCRHDFAPQMMRVVFANEKVIGKACITHTPEEAIAAALLPR